MCAACAVLSRFRLAHRTVAVDHVLIACSLWRKEIPLQSPHTFSPLPQMRVYSLRDGSAPLGAPVGRLLAVSLHLSIQVFLESLFRILPHSIARAN